MERGTGPEEEKWEVSILTKIRSESHPICGILWAGNCRVISHSTEHLEQMMNKKNEEADTRDLEPKPASLWWSSTDAEEVKEDMTLETKEDCTSSPFKNVAYMFRQTLDSQENLEGRMQMAHTARGGQMHRCTEAKRFLGVYLRVRTRATIRLAESCDIVRMTSHRTSVASFENQTLSFGVLFLLGPGQDLDRPPGFALGEWTSILVRGEDLSMTGGVGGSWPLPL